MPISQNFPQFVVIHTVTGLGTVSKAETDAFRERSHISGDKRVPAIPPPVPLPGELPLAVPGAQPAGARLGGL